ncbi:MAG: toll/interleukin-1 receptor domain-containing protein, partial [Alistipes sp.]|nr:toll/interleukin-1 receptor domain-containing protein [Alistipes sp.]
MQQEKYDIFISYRRKDENGKEWGTSIARNVLQGLEDRGYKGRVFFDHNKIGPEDFEKKILGAIKQAKVFLCILTKNAMDNCVNEGDWVRCEICQAIESGLKIIFLNPDNEFNHNLLPDNFPKEIEIVKTQNSIEIRSGQKFEVDIDDMVKRYISKIVPCQNISSANSQSSVPMGMLRIKTDLDCIVFNYGEEVGVVNVGEYEKLLLPIGENLLKFVSQECEDVF